MIPDAVDRLTEDMEGRWLVNTGGTQHIWDLEAMTYTRIPGPDSRAGSMPYDNQAVAITSVRVWPAVGRSSLVFFDDPERPDLVEQWRRSSTVKSIERIVDPTSP